VVQLADQPAHRPQSNTAMLDLHLAALTTTSTLAELPSHSSFVHPTSPGQALATLFEQQPELPGVMVHDGARLFGMISRDHFFNRWSRPFSLGVYLKRPAPPRLPPPAEDPLCLPASCPTPAAARLALARPVAHVYDPLLIEFPDGQARVLDLHVLLL